MTLMPVSNMAVAGLRSLSGGAARWMGARCMSAGSGGPRSRATPVTSSETTEHRIADRHRDWISARAHRHAASQAGSRLKRYPAHRAFVEMGLNLDDQRFRLIPFDDKSFIEPRQFGRLKGDVNHRAAHRDDLSCRLLQLTHRDDHSLISGKPLRSCASNP